MPVASRRARISAHSQHGFSKSTRLSLFRHPQACGACASAEKRALLGDTPRSDEVGPEPPRAERLSGRSDASFGVGIEPLAAGHELAVKPFQALVPDISLQLPPGQPAWQRATM